MIGRIAFLFALALPATAWGAPQFVLLHNGGVLSGEVRLIDNQYVVSGQDSEVRLPTDSVRFVESSLAGLVERQRAANRHPTPEDRLRLADWCGRQQLWAEAAAELLAAQRESPHNPRVQAAQRRLWHNRELAMRAQQVTPLRQDDPSRQDAAVQIASHTEPSGPVVGPLPDTALPMFTRHVQPMLVNNCTTAGCHAVGGRQTFQLNRDLLHGLANHRSTEANLIATLRAIDRADPANSPLLLAMQPSHAGGRGPRIGLRRAALVTKVQEWVALIADNPASSKAPQTVADSTTEPATDPVVARGDVEAPGYYEALLKQASAAQAGSTNASEPSVETATFEEPPVVQRGVRLKRAEPRDEFDPAIFNERFRSAEDDTQ